MLFLFRAISSFEITRFKVDIVHIPLSQIFHTQYETQVEWLGIFFQDEKKYNVRHWGASVISCVASCSCSELVRSSLLDAWRTFFCLCVWKEISCQGTKAHPKYLLSLVMDTSHTHTHTHTSSQLQPQGTDNSPRAGVNTSTREEQKLVLGAQCTLLARVPYGVTGFSLARSWGRHSFTTYFSYIWMHSAYIMQNGISFSRGLLLAYYTSGTATRPLDPSPGAHCQQTSHSSFVRRFRVGSATCTVQNIASYSMGGRGGGGSCSQKRWFNIPHWVRHRVR